MITRPLHAFPTPHHRAAADLALAFFAPLPAVDTVLLVNSLARGAGTPESDLDVVILLTPAAPPGAAADLEARWAAHRDAQPAYRAFRARGPFAAVHLDVTTGRYAPPVWDDGGGPDAFELEIGNHLAYSAPLTPPGAAFRQLQAAWLPYYDDDLRRRRLAMVRAACLHDLDYVPLMTRRGLFFQAFDRLYKAQQEFLQALFIQHRRYPLAYNKWIRAQLHDLGLPDLVATLAHLLALPALDAPTLNARAARLRALVADTADT